MDLISLAQRVKTKTSSKFNPGCVDKIFEYNENCAKDASGYLPVIIKPEPDETKKRRIN